MTTELHDYGPLLIASRLRKLSEALYAGADEIYRANGVDLPARCFPILFLLRDHGRLGISEIAISLGQTHPAVSQMSRKLLAHEVIQEWDDPLDERRRLLGLSRRGAKLMKRLAPVWNAIAAAAQELDGAHPILTSLTSIDQALGGTDFATRIRFHLTKE
jgi:DNA-binding MarR family transcriptional regulator